MEHKQHATADQATILADAARLAALAATGLMHSPAEASFDRLGRLASKFLGVPVALVSLVDGERQFFKSCVGLAEPWASRRETPLSHSFCQHVVASGEPLVIEDARLDPRVKDNLAVSDIGVIAYLGIPITIDHQVIGSFCAIAGEPRAWTSDDVATMSDLAQSVISEIVLRAEHQAATTARSRLQTTLSSIGDGIITTDAQGAITFLNPVAEALTGWSTIEAAGQKMANIFRIVHETTGETVQNPVENVLEHGGIVGLANHMTLIARDGTERSIDDSAAPIRLADGTVIGCVLAFRDITERREQEIRLDESRMLLDAMLAAGDIGTWTWNLIDDCVISGGCLARIFGFPADQSHRIPLRSYIDRIYINDQAGVSQKIAAAVATGDHYNAEYRMVRPDGEIRWVIARGQVRRDADGKPTQFPGVVIDISEQKRSAEQIRKSEERYRSLFNSIDEGFCVIKLIYDEAGHPNDYRFLEINPAFERHTGLTGAVGKRIGELAPGRDAAWIEAYAKVVETGEDFRTEGDATVIEDQIYQIHAFRVGNPVERKVAILSTDITHRRQAELATQHQASRLQKLAEFSVRLTDAHDVNSVLGIVTEAARDLIPAHHVATTMIPDARYPQPINVVSHSPERRDTAGLPDIDGLSLYGTIQQANQSIRLTSAQLDADPRWSLLGKHAAADPTLDGWLAAPLVGHDGTSMGLLQLSHKLAGEFTAEDEAILIQLTRIASIAVENARLYEELRGNDLRKDEFLAMLAHELRNPLGAISSGVDLVQRVQKPEILAELRGMIKHQVKHLTHLIDDLLDVSRITQGKVELRKETVDLTAITRKAAELAQTQIDEKRHELSVSTPGRAVAFIADPTRVEQMLANLLTNAAKYSEPGRAIDLSAKVEGSDVVFRVRDEGFGISPEMLPKVFGLFTQVDATLDRARGGLGIGLTLVKTLAELHGGTVSATSEGKDKGSSFIIRLPVGEPATLAIAAFVPLEKAVRPTPTTHRILVIDDNRDTAKMTTRLLEHQGYRTMMAHDGHEGIEAAKAFEPDMILLDIGLPGLNGYEVATAVRSHERCRKAVLVAVSGYGEAAARERSKAAGIDHHLTKPLDFDRLDEILATLG